MRIRRKVRRRNARRRNPRAGQSIIESGLVVIVMSLIFFGLFQVSQVLMAREILDNAASTGARAKAVGFDYFMIWKVVRVATIPTAGIMTSPGHNDQMNLPVWGENNTTIFDVWDAALASNPRSAQYAVEESRIPLYLESGSMAELPSHLDYEDWETVYDPTVGVSGDGMARVTVRQDFPLKFPMHRAFYADDELEMSSTARAGHYAEIYLE